MPKKKKAPSKKGQSKKTAKKVKFNKGGPYEVEWTYPETVKEAKNWIVDAWHWLMKKANSLFGK